MVEKRLLSFADVSTERLALYREAVVQKAAQGKGVVSIVDERFSGVENLDDFRQSDDEVDVIFRDFVDGYSLQDLCSMPHLWEKERCSLWIRSLAMTLSRVHEMRGPRGEFLGLVHRDVTPGNVLIEASALAHPPGEEGVWLNDFGLAHVGAWGPLSPDETLQGAPRYLPPELRAGRCPWAASDVYQAALILCALLCVHQEIHLDTLFQKDQSRSLNEQAYHLLAPWRASAALDPHPENRPTAAELAALLGT